MKNFLYFLFVFFIFPNSFSFATTLNSGPAEEVKDENNPRFVELFQLRIENLTGGQVEAVFSEENRLQLGTVVVPCTKVDINGYTASKWAKAGTVCATSVNALHIKTDHNLKDDRGVIFSIVPNEFFTPPKNWNSYLNPDASIYVNIPAGGSIFGAHFAPFVGNVVYREIDKQLFPFEPEYVIHDGDVIVIVVKRPIPYPEEMVFENRFGGLISLKYAKEEPRYVGQVLKPVMGIGRFVGTKYAAEGRIRANHDGVIDISTSPIGQVGGFQIIPANHGMSEEMGNARVLTQWMVISPLNALSPSLESVAPFFQYFLRPDYDEKDIYKENWKKSFLQRFLVQVRIKNGPWQTMPRHTLDADLSKPLPKNANAAFSDVTHLRILFPIF